MVLGIDISLTGTGVVILDKNYNIIAQHELSVVCFGVERLFHVRNLFSEFIEEHELDLACIESAAYSAEGRIFDIGELNGVLKLILFEKSIDIIEAVPSQLKKYATGKGSGKKSLILKDVYKHFGQDFDSDNICDAYVLSRIASDYLSQPAGLPKFQIEVLKAIHKKYDTKTKII